MAYEIEVLAASEEKLAGNEERPRLLLLIGAGKANELGLRRMPVAMVVAGYKGKQKFSVTREDLADIVRNFRKRQTGDLVVDYDHATLAAGGGDATPAAGWLKSIDDAPDAKGVLWGDVEYTERAARMVDAREYKYTSPVIEWGVRDKTSGDPQGATMTSIALTNSPLFERMPALPLAASDTAGWTFDRGDVVDGREKQVKITKVILAGAAGKVRLVADDNTETEMQVEGLRLLSMADVKRGSDGRWDFASLPQGEGVVVASDVLRAIDVQAALDAAVKEGKVTPAQRGFYEKSALADFAGFQTLVASMKPTVDLTEHGTGAGGRPVTTLGEMEARVLELIDAKQKANPKMSYGQAYKLVASENPDLMRKRERLAQRGE